jgi:hypothetical protein
MYGPWAALLPIRATGVEDDDPLVGVFCFPFLFFCVGTLTSSNASDCLNRAAGDPGDRGIKSPGGRSAPSIRISLMDQHQHMTLVLELPLVRNKAVRFLIMQQSLC